MATSARIRVADVRAIRDLTYECRDLGDDPRVWRAHWQQQLGRLIGADLIIGGDVAIQQDGRISPMAVVECGWENGFDRTSFLRAFSDYGADLSHSLMIDGYFQRPDGADGAGVTRNDVVSDSAWYSSPYYQLVQRGIGIDHCLMSFHALTGRANEYTAVTLSRGTDVRRNFSRRDGELLREAHAGISSLIGGPLARFDEPSPGQLAPRMRQVLRYFLEGDSDKQVALRMGITRYTVNEYGKAIYRHFGVSSRAELLARWIRRGWGARFAWTAE